MTPRRVIGGALPTVLVLSAVWIVHAQLLRYPTTRPSEAQRNAGPGHRYDPQALDVWLKAVESHRPGIIDEPRIVNRGLSNAEVQTLFDQYAICP